MTTVRNRVHSAVTMASLFIVSVCLCYCNGRPSPETTSSGVKFDQYYVKGEQLYIANCSNCHQKTGTGLGLVYPPLNKSDFIDNNMNEVLCLIRNGKSGELAVNGKIYNQAMPPNPNLTDLDIAEIATYIYNSWERKKGIIEVTRVSSVLNECDSLK